MSPQQISEFNKRVGENLARFRRMADLSQTELAQELTDRGFPFQQQTILKVEKGTRPLKFEEAHALAEILGVSSALLPDQDQENQDGSDAAGLQLVTARRGRAKVRAQIAELEEEIRHYEVLERESERRLAENGAIQGIDGAWHWKNADGSVSAIPPEGGDLRTDPVADEVVRRGESMGFPIRVHGGDRGER